MTTKEKPDVANTEERVRKKARIVESFARSVTEVAEAERSLEKARARRKTLVDLALSDSETGLNLFSYDEVAAHTQLSRGAVYKLRRDGFKSKPLNEQRAEAADK
jgi:hypothetical protein